MNEHILIVDDERALADLLSIYLTNAGFRTSICADGASALAAIAQEAPDLALLDVRFRHLPRDPSRSLFSHHHAHR